MGLMVKIHDIDKKTGDNNAYICTHQGTFDGLISSFCYEFSVCF